MREIAQRRRLIRWSAARRLTGTAVAVLATLTAVAALGAPSALAVTGVTVTTVYGQNPISLNASDAIGYTIANTAANGTTLSNFSFSDTLPAGVTLDNPISLTNTAGSLTKAAAGGGAANCGTATTTNPVTGNPSAPGDSAVTITVTQVPATTAKGTVCTIALGIVASTPSTNDAKLSDTYSNVSAGGAGVAAGLVVLSNPLLSFTEPTPNKSFYLGQVFDASFGCTATDPEDSIDTFYGTDDEGNQIASGAPIDTVDAGAHSLEVDCISAVGGGDVSQTVNYKVGSYALSSVKVAKKTDQVSFKSLLPAGKLVATVLDGKKKVGTTTLKVTSRKTVSVTIKPTAAGKKLLAKIKGKTLKVTVQGSFTPSTIGSGDSQITPATATVVTKSLKLPIAHAAAKK